MKIRRFYGKDMREALNQVKHELGGDAVIMSNKKVADGVEIVAAYDNEPEPAPQATQPKPKGKIVNPLTTSTKSTPSLSEIIGDSGPDSLKALLEKQNNGGLEPESAKPEPVKTSVKPQERTVRAPEALVSEQSSSNAMDDIKQELRSLRDVLEFQVSGLLTQEKHRQHPLQAYLTSRLMDMGISESLAEEVVSYAPENTDEREAWLFILKLLTNRIKTNNDDILGQSGVMALIGPTGTGKTTTIAKLAAQYAQKYGANEVAMVTIDSYRIAAYEQLATYGKIIGCPVKKASNAQELSDVLYQFRNKRLVLIDTAGFGQRDARIIKQLDTLKEASCANIKMYLVLQANTQRQVLEKSIEAFNHAAINGCIFTKLDECYSLGEAVSVAIEERLPISYLTDGQRVPEDLKVAEAKYLVSTAAKLYKKYCLPHTKAQQDNRVAV